MTFDEWVAQQTGAVRRSAAVAATGDDVAFRRAVRHGALVKVAHDIYLPAAAARGSVDLAERARAVTDAFGPDAYVSHSSAAELQRVATLRCCSAIHVTREPGKDSLAYRTPLVDLRLASVPESHRTLVEGVRAVTVARAVVDIARTRPFVDGLVAADSALHDGLAPRLLAEVLEDCTRWPGIRRARAVVDFADPLAESALESGGRWLMCTEGLPRPQLQHWLGYEGERQYRADFYFAEQRTVGEADGLAKYRSTDRDVAQAQHDRDADLADLGLEVVHFSWLDVFARPPARLAARFRRAFARAELRRPAG